MNFDESHKGYLSKPEIQFWLPIVTYAVTLSISYMLLSNQIALLSQKIDQFTEKEVTLNNRVDRLAQSLNDYVGTVRAHIGQ
jgi:outer membrane murein-binding lipoprotein Lpp